MNSSTIGCLICLSVNCHTEWCPAKDIKIWQGNQFPIEKMIVEDKVEGKKEESVI